MLGVVSFFLERCLSALLMPRDQNLHSSSSPFLDFALTLPASSSAGYSVFNLLSDLHQLGKENFSSNRIFIATLMALGLVTEANALQGLIALPEGVVW